jgi:superfamily II DNA or RNA helicase
MNRQEIQLEAVKAWVDSYRVGTIILATGGGKTHIGSAIAAKQIYNKKISSVLIVVPTVNLVEQWRGVLDEYFPGVTDIIDILCLKTAYKIVKAYDLLIIDEAHTALSPEYRKIFSNITYKQLLCLTATIPDNKEYADFLQRVAPVVYNKGLDEIQAEDNVISPYKMYNLEINFNRPDRSKYQIFDTQFKEAQMQLAVFKRTHREILLQSTFDIAKDHCAIKNESLYIDEKIKALPDYNERYQEYAAYCSDLHHIIKYSKQYWSGMTMRKWTCYESTSKLEIVVGLLKQFPKRKWIIFNKSIKFAERLAKLIPNSLIYHSKQNAKEREEALASFRTAEYNVLIAVDALNAGLDVPDADAAITVSGVSTELVGTQTLGRVLRFKPNKLALFINLYTKNTVEENWTKNRTSAFKNCVWVNNTKMITI